MGIRRVIRAGVLCIGLAVVFGFGCANGCQQDPAGNEASSTHPRSAPPRILNDPDGLPEPLPAGQISLWIRRANDWAALTTYLKALGPLVDVSEGSPNVQHWPRLRVALRDLAGLPDTFIPRMRASSVSGHLVFWYSTSTVRDRLIDGGRAGLQRGVSWYRESLPWVGDRVKAPPLFLVAALSTDSFPLNPPLPAGFNELMNRRGSVPESEKGDDGSVQLPTGEAVRLLIPTSGELMGEGIDRVVESLHALEQRGARSWMAIATPVTVDHWVDTPSK